MREPRNPFRMRSSEHIDSDATFIRLLCPEGLDILPDNKLWERIQIFRSAPGGGKTTLLRAFTPGVLNTLYDSQSNEDYRELFNKMKQLEVIAEEGPKLLGVVIPCSRNYVTLEDLHYNAVQKERLFYALLNARIVLAVLRNLLMLKKMNYPNDLQRIRFEMDGTLLPVDIETPCTGWQIYEWARAVEKKVSVVMDSFGPMTTEHIIGHDTLLALEIIKPEHLRIDDVPLKGRVLIMFDDVHQLSQRQRKKLLQTVMEARPAVSVWIAERLEALTPDELLAPGAIAGRDYEVPVKLEDYWHNAHTKRFVKVVTDIADRRARSARDIQIVSFDSCLQDALDGPEWNGLYQQAMKVIEDRIRKRIGSSDKYENWIASQEIKEGTLRQRALAWRMLEIIIERDRRKNQITFDFGEVLPVAELEQQDTSSARAGAECYLAQEFNIPYYYNVSRLAAIASSNIEQFLDFSGELFEEIIASALLKKQQSLSPARQQAIYKKVARQRWEDIVRRIPNGRRVQNFLEAIRDMAKDEWNKGTASYGGGGGITGIGITMDDRERLIRLENKYEHAMYKKLINTLSLCISNNLLEVSLDHKQGGKTWMTLYLNRWLCVHFDLPLHYGGWKGKRPEELVGWLDKGFQAAEKNGGNRLL